jgi:hypothetical protein
MVYPYEDEDRRAALTQGLLAAGLAALGAKRGSEYNALGQAGLLGLGGYNAALRTATDARDSRAEREMKAAEWAQKQQQWAEQQRQQKAMQLAATGAFTGGTPAIPGGEAEPREGGMTPGLPAYGGQFNPQAYISALQQQGLPMQAVSAAEKYAPKRIAPDAPKPEHFTGESLAKFAQSGDWNALVSVQKPVERWKEIGQLGTGQMLMENTVTGERKAVGSVVPRTSVTINNPMETEEGKAIGRGRGEAFVAINQGASKARAKLSSLDAIDALIGDVETSPLTPFGVKAASVVKGAFGQDIDPNLPRKVAAETIMGRMALDARSTAEGGGMPGAMSDADREFLRSMNPSLSQTREGRALIVTVQKRMAKRDQEMAQWAREYRAKQGQFDEGFQDYAAQKSAQNPLFADLAGSGGAGSGTASVYRFDKRGNRY